MFDLHFLKRCVPVGAIVFLASCGGGSPDKHENTPPPVIKLLKVAPAVDGSGERHAKITKGETVKITFDYIDGKPSLVGVPFDIDGEGKMVEGAKGPEVDLREALKKTPKEIELTPQQNTRYDLTIENESSKLQKTASVRVDVFEVPVIKSFKAEKEKITKGDVTHLIAQIEGAKGANAWILPVGAEKPLECKIVLDENGIGTLKVSVDPKENTEYVLRVENGAGKVIESKDVVGNVTIQVFDEPKWDDFVVEPTAITEGQTVKCWGVFQDGEGILMANEADLKPIKTGVSEILKPEKQTVYQLRVVNGAGKSIYSRAITVSVVPLPRVTKFEASTLVVAPGQEVKLTASFENAARAFINPGELPISNGGTVSVKPGGDTSYTLTIVNGLGYSVTSDALNVVVDTPPVIESFKPLRTWVYPGGQTKLTAVFKGISAVIEPGSIVVANNTPVDVYAGDYTLTVKNKAGQFVTAKATVFERDEDDGPGPKPHDPYPYPYPDHEAPRTITLLSGHRLILNPVDGGVQFVDKDTGDARSLGGMLCSRRGFATSLLADGKVLIAGGRNDKGVLASTEVFDPETESFAFGPDLAQARCDAAMAVLADGRVLISGGLNENLLNQAECLDLKAACSLPLEHGLSAPRQGHSATLLQDGRVLVAGGLDAKGKALESVEIFEPSTLKFKAGASLLAPCAFHEARRLEDGRVLILAQIKQAAPKAEFQARAKVELLLEAQVFDPKNEGFKLVKPEELLQIK